MTGKLHKTPSEWAEIATRNFYAKFIHDALADIAELHAQNAELNRMLDSAGAKLYVLENENERLKNDLALSDWLDG